MQFGPKALDLTHPQVMGILNVTPDSFSDGGELFQSGKPVIANIIDRAAHMIESGATLLDVGGESTRPGAVSITETEELDRVLPTVSALRARFDVVVSLDTSNAQVMQEGAAAGAGLINDVRSLKRHGAIEAARVSKLPVCLMHMKGAPGTMQDAPAYSDVIAEVVANLADRMQACEDAGISRSLLLVDPGFGFGKNLQHNLALLANLERVRALGAPLLVGISRKRMLGAVTGKTEMQREAAGIAGAVIAIQQGARIIRTHDVAGVVDAVKIWMAVNNARL